jgi:hypothetical protein
MAGVLEMIDELLDQYIFFLTFKKTGKPLIKYGVAVFSQGYEFILAKLTYHQKHYKSELEIQSKKLTKVEFVTFIIPTPK